MTYGVRYPTLAFITGGAGAVLNKDIPLYNNDKAIKKDLTQTVNNAKLQALKQ